MEHVKTSNLNRHSSDGVRDLTQGSPYSVILSFAFPFFVSQVFQQLYNVVDSLIVGRFLGTTALAAVSTSGTLIFMIVSFFEGAAMGGSIIEVNVKDPLMRPIVAQYLVQGDTAVIEIAKASGLTLLSPEERNPMVATSYGTGQLVVDAVRRGCKHVIVGLGGSATSDCGIGMLRAIIDSFSKGGSIPTGAPTRSLWDDVRELDDIRFTIATDVTNPLCGENGAAYVFGPQKFAQVKGATPDLIEALDARAKRFAEASAKHMGRDCQNMPGAGAAGGLGYAFLQYMNAECRSGIDLLLDTIHFDDLLQDADLVITGEGSADRQTLMGKLPFGILQRAKRQNIPVMLIAGRIADEQLLLDAGFSHVACINPPGLPLEIAMQPATAKENIRKTITPRTFDGPRVPI